MIQTQEKEQVIKAINELGRRVTPADVATKTGLPILQTTAALNTIASETQGHLEVSTTGDVAYKFNPGFQTTYLATGIKKVLQQVVKTTLNIGYFLLRISFGVMLIVSFILIVFLIVAAVFIMMKGSSDSDDNGGGGFSFDFFDYMILRDILWWGTWGPYPTPTYIDYDRPTTRVHKKSNFFLNVFSFLFGDGSPNLTLEERKWQAVAQAIKSHHGVVTAEQLAPFTGADPKNEDGVLPVLVRFNGKPEVTDAGNIVYQFPDLQVSAATGKLHRVPKFLQEFYWKFTNVPGESLIPVYFLAGFNFLGSWWLLFELHRLPQLMPLMPLVTALVIYGSLFVAVPTIRYFIIKAMNNRIEARNYQREQYSLALATPSSDLQLKLQQAENMAIKEKRLTTDQVIYTTEKDALEQEFDDDFDASPGS